MKHPISLLHLITGLNIGGAEIMLLRLARELQAQGYDQQVVSLISPGPVATQLQEFGIPTISLEMNPSQLNFSGIQHLIRLVNKYKPDIIQTWMYHADLLGSLASLMTSRIPVVWGIHNARLDPQNAPWHTRATVWILARLSGWLPAKIIVCSEQAQSLHIARGYDRQKIIFIPNGFDLGKFKPDIRSREAIRQELGFTSKDIVIGMVARYHPDKDPETFLRAAALVQEKNEKAKFVLCGDGFYTGNAKLCELIPEKLDGNISLLGKRNDIHRLMTGLDILALSSATEAFPLTIGEAMACGLPCVSTDVGDAKKIIGETGLVVPSHDPKVFAEALLKLMELPETERVQLGQKARQRIAENFSIEKMAQAYSAVYKRLI